VIELVPSYHHFKTTEHTPVDSKAFLAAVYKEVSNSNVIGFHRGFVVGGVSCVHENRVMGQLQRAKPAMLAKQAVF